MNTKTTTRIKSLCMAFVMMIMPMFALAQDGQDVADKITETIQSVINIAVPILILFVIAFHGGIAYMTKKPEDRSQEDGQILKQTVIRVVVGGALIGGAAKLGIWIWSSLS